MAASASSFGWSFQVGWLLALSDCDVGAIRPAGFVSYVYPFWVVLHEVGAFGDLVVHAFFFGACASRCVAIKVRQYPIVDDDHPEGSEVECCEAVVVLQVYVFVVSQVAFAYEDCSAVGESVVFVVLCPEQWVVDVAEPCEVAAFAAGVSRQLQAPGHEVFEADRCLEAFGVGALVFGVDGEFGFFDPVVGAVS